jgi:hypothetical protein
VERRVEEVLVDEIKSKQGGASPLRKGRVTRVVGLVLAAVILGTLIWYVATHTETRDDRGTFGYRSATS